MNSSQKIQNTPPRVSTSGGDLNEKIKSLKCTSEETSEGVHYCISGEELIGIDGELTDHRLSHVRPVGHNRMATAHVTDVTMISLTRAMIIVYDAVIESGSNNYFCIP